MRAIIQVQAFARAELTSYRKEVVNRAEISHTDKMNSGGASFFLLVCVVRERSHPFRRLCRGGD